MTSPRDSAHFQDGRAAVFSWLARTLLFEIHDREFAVLLDGPIPEMLDRFVPGTADELRHALANAGARDELDAEFARLFLIPGPDAVPPIVTSWMTDATTEPLTPEALGEHVSRWRVAAGQWASPPPDPELGRIPDTHIASVLRVHAAAAADTNLQTAIESVVAGPIQAFARALQANAESRYYQAVGMMLQAWIVVPGT